ncbi:EamA family transporter [Thermococcus sibiricus]|nr:EamA family transporter [Thermococcus sibiricus]
MLSKHYKLKFPGALAMKGGYIFVFLAAIMWGTLGIFAKFLYGFNLSTYTIVFYRILFALIFLAVYLKVKGLSLLIPKDRLPFYLGFSFFSIFLFYSLYFYTVKISSVSFAVLMLYTAPVYSLIFGRILFGERLTSSKIVAVFLVLLGVLLLNLDGKLNVSKLALLTGLLSGLTYSLYGVFVKFAVRKEEPEKVLFNVLLIGLLFLLPIADLRVPTAALPYLLGLAFFPTFLGYVLYNTALKSVEVSKASIIATIEPVVAIVLAYLIFGETLSLLQCFGASLIIGGAILAKK